MSFNKRILSKAVSQLDKAKAPKKPQDIIKDPRGQWAHPGQNTRIPGGDITMQNVPYPVWAQPNVGPGMMMQPGQDYNFPNADYVDEFPQMEGNEAYEEMELTDAEIEEYKRGGYIVEELPQAQGGGASYADSLAAYNYGKSLFDEEVGEGWSNEWFPKGYESFGEKINKYWNTEEGKEYLEWMKSQDFIPPGVDKFKVKPVDYGTESSFGQVFYKKPTKPRTKTYEDAYKNVDKKKYPTLESFIADAEYYKKNGRNMSTEDLAKINNVTDYIGNNGAEENQIKSIELLDKDYYIKPVENPGVMYEDDDYTYHAPVGISITDGPEMKKLMERQGADPDYFDIRMGAYRIPKTPTKDTPVSKPAPIKKKSTPGTVVPPASTLQWVQDPRTNKWHQIQRPVKSEDLESRKIGFLQEGGQLNEELELSDMEKVKLERLGYVFEKI